MEQLGIRNSPPPLSSLQSHFPLTGGKQHGQSSLLSIPPSLSTRCLKETQGTRCRTRLWASVHDRLYEHVCAQMYKFQRVYVPVRMFENVYASLPLTFCCMGGQENLTRQSTTPPFQCNIQPDIAWTGILFYQQSSSQH